MGLALARGSVLELAGIGSVGHGGTSWCLCTEVIPVAPSHLHVSHQENVYMVFYLNLF